MTLSLPNNMGLGRGAEQELHNIWSTFEETEETLAKLGFPPLEKPPHARPAVTPGVLATMTGEQITDLFIKVGAWHNYAVNYLSRIKGRLLQVENEKKVLSARLRQGAREASKRMAEKKAPADKEIEAGIVLDPRYQELMLEEQVLTQQKVQLEGHEEALSKDRAMISRTIEVRRQDLESHLNSGRALQKPGRF